MNRRTQRVQENVQTPSNVGEQETILGSEPIPNPLRVQLKEEENSGEEETIGGQEKCAHIQTQRVVDGSDEPKETNHKGSEQIRPAKKGEKMLNTLAGKAIVLVLDVRTTSEWATKLKRGSIDQTCFLHIKTSNMIVQGSIPSQQVLQPSWRGSFEEKESERSDWLAQFRRESSDSLARNGSGM